METSISSYKDEDRISLYKIFMIDPQGNIVNYEYGTTILSAIKRLYIKLFFSNREYDSVSDKFIWRLRNVGNNVYTLILDSHVDYQVYVKYKDYRFKIISYIEYNQKFHIQNTLKSILDSYYEYESSDIYDDWEE